MRRSFSQRFPPDSDRSALRYTAGLACSPGINRGAGRHCRLELQLLPDSPLPLLAHQAVTNSPFNLLQGEFAPHYQGPDQWRAWRLAAVLRREGGRWRPLGKGVEIWRLKSTEKSAGCLNRAGVSRGKKRRAERHRRPSSHGSTSDAAARLDESWPGHEPPRHDERYWSTKAKVPGDHVRSFRLPAVRCWT